MVAIPVSSVAAETPIVFSDTASPLSLEDFLQHPPNDVEWIDGQLVEKTGMTLNHAEVQAKLIFLWRQYALSSQQGGKVYAEAPCRTNRQGRRPDVAYLTPELVSQYGQTASLPICFPLIAEIASPTDTAEELFAKAQEYLESGCEEVWLVFPESRWLLIATNQQLLGFMQGEVRTQRVLIGFQVDLNELLT